MSEVTSVILIGMSFVMLVIVIFATFVVDSKKEGEIVDAYLCHLERKENKRLKLLEKKNKKFKKQD